MLGILWRWRVPSGLRWVWRNGRGPHLEGRQEPQASSPFRTPTAGSLQSWDRRVRPHLVRRNGTPLASRVIHRVTGNLSNCVWNLRVFPVVMYGCESWTVKKAERWRIDAFELLEKTLESPLDCKEIQPVHSEGDQPWDFLEGMMLKLKLQYFGHLMQS